ncbi:Cell wall biosynthesis protein [Leuconostoc gasicomitatum KG16-1]|nr:Cell wall biosynthesis protein [Leuconostoc gasicomitatum KG16-1]
MLQTLPQLNTRLVILLKYSSNAAVETNGYDLSNHRNWSGTIISVSPKAYSHSAWEYYIKYPDGEHNDFVAEQDLAMATSYPHPENGTSNTYYWGYCTYGAKQLAPWIGNGWGNANQWSSSARSAGYVVDRNPMYGSIVVFQSGQGGASSYGHVAFVESINGNTIQIKEMNGTGGFGQYSVRSVDNASSYEYIH